MFQRYALQSVTQASTARPHDDVLKVCHIPQALQLLPIHMPQAIA